VIRNAFFASLLATSAVAMTITTPAHAGEVERAREAIAAADAKIHTAEGLGAGAELPGRTAEAKAVLEHARADFDSGHRDRAIADASQASALADNVIGEIQHRKDAAVAAAQANAQQQAADANARAAAAEQDAARSAADAEAARNAAAQPAQVETTVTTEHQGASHRAAHKRVTRRTTTVAPSTSDQVTTTVTQH
jgi:hypothetical protein